MEDGFYRCRIRVGSGDTETGMVLRFPAPDGSWDGYYFGLDSVSRSFWMVRCPAPFQCVGLANSPGALFAAGEEWMLEAGVVDSRLSLKYWPVGSAEPREPQHIAYDSIDASGVLDLVAGVFAASQPTRLDVSFDDIAYLPAAQACERPAFVVSVDSGTAPLSVVFDAGETESTAPETAGELEYVWDFGDGNSMEGMEVEHTFHEAGAYQATLWVYTAAGCAMEYKRSAPIRVACPRQAAAPWISADVGART